MTRKLHHLALGARDPDRVAAFYEGELGLAEVKRHHYEDGRLRSVWLDLGGALLMIEHTEADRKRVEGVGAGPFLIAVSVGVDERDELERSLEEAGYEIEARSDYTSYTRDPEGNRVAISIYPIEIESH